MEMGVKELKGLDQFLEDYPQMSMAPCSDSSVQLQGKFRFIAKEGNDSIVEDVFRLEIVVPNKFPRVLPVVKEIGGKIPREDDFHVNRDGSLCLGSPLRLLKIINETECLNGFVSKCLVPYLYAVSNKLRNGSDFVFGELAHGEQGIIDDYSVMFSLKGRTKVKLAIEMLGLKKRIANKKLCPCGCGKRLGMCSFHHKLNDFRKMAPISWFRSYALNG